MAAAYGFTLDPAWTEWRSLLAVTRWNRGRKRTAPRGIRPTYWLVPEDPEYPAFRCEGARLPDLSHTTADAYVWPDDLAWTMAFTHEAAAMGLGPYFSRREWVEE